MCRTPFDYYRRRTTQWQKDISCRILREKEYQNMVAISRVPLGTSKLHPAQKGPIVKERQKGHSRLALELYVPSRNKPASARPSGQQKKKAAERKHQAELVKHSGASM
jgi:hypothetical protein